MIAEKGAFKRTCEEVLGPSWEEALGWGALRRREEAEERTSVTAEVAALGALVGWIWEDA